MTTFDSEVTVRKVRFSAGSGWAVLDAQDADGATVTLVGQLSHLEERERARVLGEWTDDRRYGRQVKVSQALPLAPTDAAAVVAYLRRVPHVGPARARRLVQRFGAAGVIAAIDADPAQTFAAAGLRASAIAPARAAWERLRVTRRLHMLLAPHGLAYLVTRIHTTFGDGAHRVVTERPYSLTRVFGVGFTVADRIARALEVPPDDRDRARAAAAHLLAEAERAGNSCLPEDALARSMRELLGEPAPSGVVDELVDDGELVRDGQWIYRRRTAELEAELAERVAALVRDRPDRRLRDPGEIAPRGDGVAGDGTAGGMAGEGTAGGGMASDRTRAGGAPGDALTREQWSALRAAFTRRLSLVTGGPGTGKTATIRAIAAVAARQRARVMLVAPTGRAAVRMSEAAGLAATTIHSALGWIPGQGATHDEQDPLDCDVLVVDETSMANLELLVTLLRAVARKTNVVLVGDADQLAPVGAGKPFAELVAGEAVATTRLTHIFRQAAGSMIVQAAHAVRQGRTPTFAPSQGMRRDLFMIDRPNAAAARDEIIALVAKRLPAYYGVDPVRDIQLFVPVYSGDLGIDALNAALREALNPDGRRVADGRLRIGDKLMMTGRNLHELGLMNGTVLTLLDETGGDDDDAALVLAGEESVFRVPTEESSSLRLAYACSVHRGQGIELPIAVIVAHPAAGAFFLRREMLYTAITRARLATIIVGSRDAIARAARTPDTDRRHSRLFVRLERALAGSARTGFGASAPPGAG